MTLPFTELFDEETWQAIEAQGDGVRRRDGAHDRRGRAAARCAPGKEFVVRAHSFEGATLAADDPWFSAVRLAPDARRRERVPPPLVEALVRRPLVHGAAAGDDERVASQNWHVDFDDKHLLKAFVYLSDVGTDHGPFEYVPGSQPGGRHHDVRPWVPMGYGRVADEDVARSVPAEEIATLHGPEGDAHPLQHERPPPRRLRDGRAARARDRDLLLARVARRRSRTATTTSPLGPTTDPVVRYAVS